GDTTVPHQFHPLTKQWIFNIIDHEAPETMEALTEIEQAKVHNAIQAAIDNANALAECHSFRIQKWRFLPQELSFERGELTPSQKIKREAVDLNYSHLIDAMYNS
ncbi:unnamed protein product, partial [Cyprideis torosa]